jgi:WD40 repeat protein
VRLWDLATGKSLGPPFRHEQRVRTVAFSPDGQWVLTGSEDHTARLWEMPHPAAGTAAEVNLGAELLTGLRLDESDGIRLLDTSGWQERQKAHKAP